MQIDIYIETGTNETFEKFLSLMESSGLELADEFHADGTAISKKGKLLAGAITPALIFSIGCFFNYLSNEADSFEFRDEDGRVIVAKGDTAQDFLDYLIDNEFKLSK